MPTGGQPGVKEGTIPVAALWFDLVVPQTLTAGLELLAAGKLITLLQQTSFVSRVVLFILLLFSLFSWAIILQKFRSFSAMQRQTNKFLQMLRSTQKLLEPKTLASTAAGSPLVAVYAAGYHELQSQLTPSAASAAAPRLKSLNAINVVMHLVAAEEVHKMERWMPWLATTGSVTPFIGLFGTVLGVMDSFAGLGEAGAASLRAVAPGISEALIATAAGLAAAIPAVIFYNHFLHAIKDFAGRMNNFTAEFVAQLEKQYSA